MLVLCVCVCVCVSECCEIVCGLGKDEEIDDTIQVQDVVDLLVVVEQIYLFLLSFINVLEHCAVKGIDAEATTAKLLFFRLPFFIAPMFW